MRRGIPVLTDGAAPPGDQSFWAELMVKRQGAVWAKVHAPVHGPALFAAYGLFAFIEQWAHDADYEQTTVPAMVALAGLCDLYYIVLEGEGWESMRMLTQFNDVIGALASADDPRDEYSEFLASIMDEDPAETSV